MRQPKCRSPLLIQNPQKLKEAKCPACGFLNPIPEEEAPTQLQTRQPTELGWLIVKDEQTATQTFVLTMGVNVIGRQSNLSPSTHMIVTNDEFMSRPHCTLTVRIGIQGNIEYLLQDGAAQHDGTWKLSRNGTYLNGEEQRLSEFDCLYLSDGDIIQIGVTKLVLKTPALAQSVQKAYRQVEDMDYGRTVIGFKTP
ncbi:FHA domain-containing protein [Spirosoma telluris]